MIRVRMTNNPKCYHIILGVIHIGSKKLIVFLFSMQYNKMPK